MDVNVEVMTAWTHIVASFAMIPEDGGSGAGTETPTHVLYTAFSQMAVCIHMIQKGIKSEDSRYEIAIFL